jgi:hypothetical protein
MGRAISRTGDLFLGCRKVDFWFPIARKKPEILFSTPEAGLPGQKSIMINAICFFTKNSPG